MRMPIDQTLESAYRVEKLLNHSHLAKKVNYRHDKVPRQRRNKDERTAVGVAWDAFPFSEYGPSLRVKRLDHVYQPEKHMWTYQKTKVRSTPQVLHGGKTSDGVDVWQSFCFVVVRKIPAAGSPAGSEPTVSVTIKNPYLRTVCKDIIGDIPGLSWTVDPLELSTDLLISMYPSFAEYHGLLKKKQEHSDDEEHVLRSLEPLLDYMRADHQAVISQIANFLTNKEITSDLLYTILVPGTVLISLDPATGEPCASQLKGFSKGPHGYTLRCEGLGVVNSAQDTAEESTLLRRAATQHFGRVIRTLNIPYFEGVVKINSLPVYPMRYHSDEAGLKAALLARARKWVGLNGVHHMYYQGTAVVGVNTSCGRAYIKYQTDSRVMIDRGMFKQHNANYPMPRPAAVQAPQTRHDLQLIRQPSLESESSGQFNNSGVEPDNQKTASELSDDELLLASPVLYGFGLSDKIWLEFNVEKVQPIVWSDEPFVNLVLPNNRRELLRSLVEAHSSNLEFDDFVRGKGQGLVINLFGPPGVGKTLSAEATSEHLKRPLYMVGGGDLGTDANTVDATLKSIFSIAASWKAIVLIDEADVFLEQRSLHDLSRNAMVAVFLRHLEYYRGILFLTTNRVKAFDPAFLSRIHVALSFKELTKEAKLSIWKAFLRKVSMDDLPVGELDDLVGRGVNGRQIKNATRTAISLAKSRGEKLGYRHLAETLDAMEEFESDFAAMRISQT